MGWKTQFYLPPHKCPLCFSLGKHSFSNIIFHAHLFRAATDQTPKAILLQTSKLLLLLPQFSVSFLLSLCLCTCFYESISVSSLPHFTAFSPWKWATLVIVKHYWISHLSNLMEKIGYEVGSVALKVLVEAIGFFAKTLSFLSSLAFDPLFSAVVVLYCLILLYLPQIFVDLVFSPVLISTAVLLSTLLRLGAIQSVEEQKEIDSSPVEDHKCVECETETDTEKDTVTEACFNSSSKPFVSACNPFVEWNVRAPLEVIFEEYEGEEEEDSNNTEESRQMGIDRMLSLSLYYPESDSDSSSDGDFPAIERWDSQESMCFRWNEEGREGLIEIQLDGKSSSDTVFQVEEENLIEIDLSHTPF